VSSSSPHSLERIDDFRWRIPRQGAMRVDGLVFASESLMRSIRGDQAVTQVANVATLPGIVEPSIGMPDIHWGYGFAIGGVAAFDPAQGGVISPGGVGFDINCGVRLLATDLSRAQVTGRIATLMDELAAAIPAGMGQGTRDKLGPTEVADVLREGASWAVEHGSGVAADLERIEGGGRLAGADPRAVSERAIDRGRAQLGTVGSGNHFVEVGYVSEVYEPALAQAFGLSLDRVTILVHSGSRGLGYQVCDDFLPVMLAAARKHGIELPDRQLACAPLGTPEADRYLAAMAAAANYAFANRQLLGHRVRQVFAKAFGLRPGDLRLVYDVAHNIAKLEEHVIGGKKRRLCVHRKGATRAFPPGHPELPAVYRETGQPVLIPGDMGRYSYVLAGTEAALRESFGSSCHGAGRAMSRKAAQKVARGRALEHEFRAQGIEVRGASFATIAEEIPEAYKDVAEVVDAVHGAGIGRKVAQLRPLGVLKG
jgi:tRNA-splicing ligase RtcB (3'-phosphate/5'-hydroxy nucleic acid ligase)